MAVKSSVFQRVQMGNESTHGSLATVNRRMPNMMMAISPKWDVKKYRGQGSKFTNVVAPNRHWSEFTYDGPQTYGEYVFVLASLFGLATPTPGSGSSYTWVFAPSISNPDQFASYTMEQGDFNSGYRTRFGMFADGTFAFDRSGDNKMSGKGFGQQYETGVLLTNLNALWTLTITGSPTGGTFTISVGGQTTAGIAYNAAASVVKTALELLTTVGSGNSILAGGPGPGTPWTIKLTGPAAGQAVTVDGTSLTGGSSPTIASVSSGGTGAAQIENVPVIGSTIDIFLDSTYGGIGTTKLTDVMSCELSLTNRWGQKWSFDSSKPSWNNVVELAPTAGLKLSMESTSQSDAFVAQINAATTKYLRILATGPTITGGVTYLAQFDVPFTGTDNSGFKDLAGVWTADWVFEPMADPTAAFAMQATIVNKVASL